jgi:hypothetical protein
MTSLALSIARYHYYPISFTVRLLFCNTFSSVHRIVKLDRYLGAFIPFHFRKRDCFAFDDARSTDVAG